MKKVSWKQYLPILWPSANKVWHFGKKLMTVYYKCSCVFLSIIHYFSWKIGFSLWKLMDNRKKWHLMKKIQQDCDYTKVCLREHFCRNTIIVPRFSLLVAKYGTWLEFNTVLFALSLPHYNLFAISPICYLSKSWYLSWWSTKHGQTANQRLSE